MAKYHSFPLFTAADLSQATLTSAIASVELISGYSIHFVSTGTGVGTIKLQASNDGTNFIDITGASQALAAPGNNLFNVEGAYYRHVRAVYTKTSGTGAITGILYGKE